MNISNEDDVRLLIKSWKNESKAVQARNVRIAVETVELNMMYYEQKEQKKGVERMKKCLMLLKEKE